MEDLLNVAYRGVIGWIDPRSDLVSGHTDYSHMFPRLSPWHAAYACEGLPKPTRLFVAFGIERWASNDHECPCIVFTTLGYNPLSPTPLH